jgi:hypothetical protein
MTIPSPGHLDLNLTTIKDLIRLAKKNNAIELNVGNGHQHFHMKFAGGTTPYPAQALDEIEADTKLPTEDELLYWSTQYEPDIKADKPE